MSADGSATVFCFTPRRVPVDELLRDQDAAAALGPDRAPALVGAEPALPTQPCPVCPFLAEKLAAARETAYWRAMHQRASDLAAKLKHRIGELEAKLRLREQ